MFRAQSLRSRLALSIALLVSLLSWLLGSLISQDSAQRIREDVGRDLAEVSHMMIDRLDRDMQSRASMLQVIGSLRVLRQPADIDDVRRLLDHLQGEFPSIAWIGFTDTRGTVLASSNRVLEGASIAQRPVFLEGSKGLFIGDVHEAVLLAKLLPNPTGEAMKFVDISLPVHAADGSLVGVLASHLSWSWADEVRQAILKPIEERRQIEFFVVGRDRTLLLAPTEMIGQRLHLPAMQDLPGNTTHWAVQQWPDGKQYLTGLALSQGYLDYQGLGWTVVARQSLAQADAPVQAIHTTIVLWGGVLAVLFAACGWLLATYVTRPLRSIAKAADRLANGEIIVIPEVDSPREVAQLSHSIRHLVESLTHQHAELGALDNRAHHDPLTGLPNRAALARYLPRAELRSQGTPCGLAVLYLDLDGFKPVNDRHGHAVGDQVLRESASRMRGCLRAGDLVVRLGGDEFLMILQVPFDEAAGQARQMAERAIQTLGAVIEWEGRELQIGCSIGGALWPQDHASLEQVVELADQALYRAKQNGRGRAVFHGEPQIDNSPV
ncbi:MULTISPECIES: GGDEF domain-containing protein [Pseudomonas]|uniref:diguanylate cyclase n=1 Tax=Pseudomonas fulva TaxID=47880 RepID=A0A0D0L274_9PSED|nr:MULTISPECIES: GGDEF domain-containing protein [Pseudomonas]KIQ06579.1 diguanylate cyclase [Pseudomonas fulva]